MPPAYPNDAIDYPIYPYTMEFYILIDGKTEGPFSLEKLKEMPVTPQTKVWRQGMPEWLPAEQVGELNFLFGTPPPAPAMDDNRRQAESSTLKIAPRTWLVESILITVLCCLPFGIVGIVYASKVSTLLNIGQYDEAVAASKEAGKWVKIGFITGLIGIILYVLVVFLVIYTTDTSDMSYIDV